MRAKKADFPTVVKVRTNIKSQDGSVYEESLTPRVMLLGPRGSGKTALLHAIELALTGRVTDLMGRSDAASATMLAALAPPHQEIIAEVTLSTGEVVRYAGSEKHAPYPQSLLLREVEEHLTSDTKARSWLLRTFGEGVTEAHVREAIPAALRERFSAYYALTDMAAPPLARVEQVRWILADKLKQLQQRVAEARAVQHNATQVPATWSDAQVAEVKTQLAAKERAVALVHACEIAEEFAAVSAQATALQAADNAADAAAAVQIPEATYNLVVQLRAFAHAAHEAHAQACPLCETSVDVHRWAAQVEAIDAFLATVGPAGRAPDENQLERLQLRLDALSATWSGLPDDVRRITMDALKEGRTPTFEQKAKILGEHQELRDRWLSYQATAAQRALVESARSTLATHEEQKVTYTTLQAAVNEAIAQLLSQLREKIEAQVQRYMPEGLHFSLALEPVRLGLLRGDVVITALSGGEWSAVQCALALAALDFGYDTGPIVIIPRERAFDPEALRDTLRALGKGQGQVILYSPTPAKGRTPKAWSEITFPRGAAQADVPDATPVDAEPVDVDAAPVDVDAAPEWAPGQEVDASNDPFDLPWE